jgi:hypothetical protein
MNGLALWGRQRRGGGGGGGSGGARWAVSCSRASYKSAE